jgi:hypothetical protein
MSLPDAIAEQVLRALATIKREPADRLSVVANALVGPLC